MSNNSSLERFIQQNRRDFDQEMPDADIWQQVEKQLPKPPQARRFSRSELIRWAAAAAILVAILTSVYFLYIKNSHEKQPVTPEHFSEQNRQELPANEEISPEYAVQFQQMTASVEARQQALKAAASGLPGLYSQFEKDLDVLDSSFNALKIQAAKTPNRDVLIRAMIQNLRLQSELLERQLQVIQEFKNTQKTSHEKTI